ncbi:MAG: substrate-binding domain-containing protein, partial [Ilumatobacteraceae bacterium]
MTEPAGETTPGTDAAGGGTIAFAHPHRAGDFYSALKAGAQEAADERGYELVESFADGSIEAQIAEVNTWLAQGEIDAITIHSLDVNAMAPLVESAHAEGVPWIACATPVDGADGSVLFEDRK